MVPSFDLSAPMAAQMELHGRQFVAGPSTVRKASLSGRASFGPLQISFNSRVAIVAISGQAKEFTLLGHIIDPASPDLDNREVLQRFASIESFDQAERELAELGGRYVLLIRLGNQMRLYPDATGSKSVFFSSGWIASQPGLLGYPVDNGLASYPKATTWPVGDTPFAGVQQLLPNHYLDLEAFRAFRFGPGPIAGADIDDAVQVISKILEGTIKAAANRGAVALGLTGGYDSRTLLSAGLGVLEQLSLFTVVDERTDPHDFVTPNVLAKRVRRPLRVVRPDRIESVAENTCGLYQDSNEDRTSAFAQADFVLLGHVSPILRCIYWADGISRDVTPELLSTLAGFNGAFQDRFARWLAETPKDCGIDPLDLFYWESRCGLWGALDCTASDGYCDVIFPYNCRRLIETGLGIDVAYRRSPFELHRRLCSPELRDVDFNWSWLEDLEQRFPPWFPWRARMLMRRIVRFRSTREA